LLSQTDQDTRARR